MPKPFICEQTVTVEGETLTLVLNFRALDAIEGLLDRSFDDILRELNSGSPRLGLVGKVLWGLLREKHPDVTLEETSGLMFGEIGATVGIALQALLDAAFPPATEKKAKDENPPKRRGASKPS